MLNLFLENDEHRMEVGIHNPLLISLSKSTPLTTIANTANAIRIFFILFIQFSLIDNIEQYTHVVPYNWRAEGNCKAQYQ